MSAIVIVGTGDHARVMADVAFAAGHHLAGHVEPDAGRLDRLRWDGAPLLGTLDRGEAWAEKYRGASFVVAIGANDVRRRAFERCRDMGLKPIALVHPSAVLLGGAIVEPGAQICALALVGVAARIAEDAIVNSSASLDHDVVIEAHAFIGPGARLAGRVRVGTGVHIGIGATVREGTIIGPGALIAAGAVVVADVPAGARVAGVPARPMDE